ncbi:MAG: 2Fe-2S iron-sulfur cluster-binding protein [Sulfurimicrobium sp.]
MANITFSSPALKKDVTVYAIAGDRKTLLSVAQEHKIPIHYECQDGECGSCAVQVTPLGGNAPKAVHLTEKEKIVLVLNGKLSKSDLEKISLIDVAPKWRMACQYILLDEDILVEF